MRPFQETVKRSDLAGWAQYGYWASHSRYFWGLRLHLVCTLGGLPIAFALTGAEGRQTRDPARHLRHRSRTRLRPARTDADRRQELLRPRVRSTASRRGHRVAAPSRVLQRILA